MFLDYICYPGSIKERKWSDNTGPPLPKSRKHCWKGTYLTTTCKLVMMLHLHLFLQILRLVVVLVMVRSLQISLEPVQGKKVEHNGIKIELLGQIGELNMCKCVIK